MSKEKNLIICLPLVVIVLILIAILLVVPNLSIKLNGDKYYEINVGETYEELGAISTASNCFFNQNISYQTSGYVNTNELGSYTITYNTKYKNILKSEVRVIKVVDKEAPVITLNAPVKSCKINNTLDIDVTATDNYDGDITDLVEYNVSNDKIFFRVKDSSDNEGTIDSDIKYMDSESPIITLNGDSKLTITEGTTYNELGAVAKDYCDGDISDKIVISGLVDSNLVGTYQITYKVINSNNIESSIVRDIEVISKPKLKKQDENKKEKVNTESNTSANNVIYTGTVYLTFDDGPCANTEAILNVLDNYNVKATFFVTNQFSNYQYLIGEEYKRGHTVGIHTYSHKWTIYDSIDEYMNDFYKMSQIIYNQTGEYTKIFRFPGGSSNTVSKKHSEGIVSTIAEKLQNEGYNYYDWNLDSGDTGRVQTKSAIIKNIKKNLWGNRDYIILMHDIKKNTLAALPTIIEYAKSLGYNFSKIDSNTPLIHSGIVN